MDTQPSTKKLYRSRTNKIIAGVCGGLGEYFDIDPLIFRILFVVLLLGGGAGFWIYLVLMIVIPKAPFLEGQPAQNYTNAKEFAEDLRQGANHFAQEVRNTAHGSGLNDRRTAIGAVIVVVGVLFLLNQFLPFSFFQWHLFWPVVLILVGIAIIVKRQ